MEQKSFEASKYFFTLKIHGIFQKKLTHNFFFIEAGCTKKNNKKRVMLQNQWEKGFFTRKSYTVLENITARQNKRGTTFLEKANRGYSIWFFFRSCIDCLRLDTLLIFSSPSTKLSGPDCPCKSSSQGISGALTKSKARKFERFSE